MTTQIVYTIYVRCILATCVSLFRLGIKNRSKHRRLIQKKKLLALKKLCVVYDAIQYISLTVLKGTCAEEKIQKIYCEYRHTTQEGLAKRKSTEEWHYFRRMGGREKHRFSPYKMSLRKRPPKRVPGGGLGWIEGLTRGVENGACRKSLFSRPRRASGLKTWERRPRKNVYNNNYYHFYYYVL